MQSVTNGAAFVQEQIQAIRAFCAELDQKLPAYSYVPLTNDAQRVLVMQSRLYNELRAGEVFGGWLATTPEMEVKHLLAEACHEEFVHARLLTERIAGMGAEPLDYGPPPEQVALFHTMHRLEHTVERLAAFQLAGEIVASHLIKRALESPKVPEWIKAPYRRILEDEDEHGSGPVALVSRYADSAEAQRLIRRSVRLGLELRRHYFAALDAM
ncbi:MAG TPA: ferritin-like domain-containing protein, partial [Chloroflexota bacterium]